MLCIDTMLLHAIAKDTQIIDTSEIHQDRARVAHQAKQSAARLGTKQEMQA
jgi:hypothetical protein